MYTHIFNRVYKYFNLHMSTTAHSILHSEETCENTEFFLHLKAGSQWSSTRPRCNALAGARDVNVGASDQGRQGGFSIYFFPFFEEGFFFQEPQNLQNHRVVKERMFLWNMIAVVSDLDGFNLTATTIATSRCPSNFSTVFQTQTKIFDRILNGFFMVCCCYSAKSESIYDLLARDTWKRVSLPNSRLAIKLFFFPIHFEGLFTKNFKPFKLFCDFTRLVCCFWLLWKICYASLIPPGPHVLPLNLLHGGQEREREMAARFFPSLGILVEDIGYRDFLKIGCLYCLKHHCFFCFWFSTLFGELIQIGHYYWDWVETTNYINFAGTFDILLWIV